MRLRPRLSIAVVLAAAALFGSATAQEPEWKLDTGVSAPAKGKKAKLQQTATRPNGAAKPDKGPAKAENRQFGELEGWSPGKSPPKKKEKGDDSSLGRGPVNMNPTGNMAIGMPF
jgi:hypothetical protein